MRSQNETETENWRRLCCSFTKARATGPITELTDSKITVQKGKEKWEVDRTAATKVDGELKVGQKVTIEYTMTADKVEVKK
ncbi:hypothetical protein D3C72_1225340 [compost metagenome]